MDIVKRRLGENAEVFLETLSKVWNEFNDSTKYEIANIVAGDFKTIEFISHMENTSRVKSNLAKLAEIIASHILLEEEVEEDLPNDLTNLLKNFDERLTQLEKRNHIDVDKLAKEIEMKLKREIKFM